ncbi:class C sortase [Actinomycetaceae bacterium MB13-C1-2]|nr:class C sortase [Actinomycetaceae bacterium MB13-C1-2]
MKRLSPAQHALKQRRWRFSWLNLAIALVVFAAATVFAYPYAAQWVSQYNQSNIIIDQAAADRASGAEYAREQIAKAQEYNRQLQAGGVMEAGSNLVEGTGVDNGDLNYWNLLNNDPNHVMARLRIPSIKLDLPVYHGTSDQVLLKGVGHLQRTSLPVGGVGTRSVLTGHRGLADAEIFTHLDRVKEGDTFSVEVMGEVFTYRVIETKVVEPNETEEIRAVPDKDLVTLITCTPLGINTHRFLVTGERVWPTPQADLDAAGERPSVPSFPWWLVIYLATVVAVAVWYWRAGYPAKTRRRSAESEQKQHQLPLPKKVNEEATDAG